MATIVDLTLDSDDEADRRNRIIDAHVVDDGDDSDLFVLPMPDSPRPLVATQPATPASVAATDNTPPQLEITTQPAPEVVEAQMEVNAPRVEAAPMALDLGASPLTITAVPSFHAARDETLQVNDTFNVRRLATHAQALASLSAASRPALPVDVGGQPISPLAAAMQPLPVVEPPVETLLLLERVSPLVTNRRTQYEQGDEFGFTDTFQFPVEPDADIGAYQHGFAFTAGRYNIAPPVAALHRIGLFSHTGPPSAVKNDETWNDYDIGDALSSVGARGSGGLPTILFDATLGNSAVLTPAQFARAYGVLERRGGTRFSAQVLMETMDDVRARISSHATRPRVQQILAGGADVDSDVSSSESETDTAAEKKQVFDDDGDALPSLTETDERNLEHIRALLTYESMLLERNGVWRARVDARQDRDGLYLVTDRLREYRLSAEDECYEYRYDSYVEMNDDETDTLDERIRVLPAGTDVRKLRLPQAFYERLEIDETQRLGVKSERQVLGARRPATKNVLRARADPASERPVGPETEARREARQRGAIVETIDSDAKKRTFEDAALADEGSSESGDNDDEDQGDGISESGSDKESVASDADINAMRRALDEEAYGDLNLTDTIADDAPARLHGYPGTTIAVPLEWDRTSSLALVRAAYQNGDPLDEDTPWWKTSDDVWTAIVELALYEKLVPCFGPAFPGEARETLGIQLELLLRRINAENQFLEVNRSNWRQLLRQRDEVLRDVADRIPTPSERAQLAKLSARGESPLDTYPVLLRVCVPNNSLAFGFLPDIDAEQESIAHIYALAGQRPASTVDRYAATPLRIESDTCEPEQNYYPFASTYGRAAAIGKLFNSTGADDSKTVRAIGVLRAYAAGMAREGRGDIELRVAEFRNVSPSVIGEAIYQLAASDDTRVRRESETAILRGATKRTPSHLVTRVFIDAVYNSLEARDHNRVKPVFLAPPRLSRLASMRRAVQGPLFEEAFGEIGQFDAIGLARTSALKEQERALRAYQQLEDRGAERLYANAAVLYAQEHSSPYHRYVADQAPRVRTNFRVQPPDLSLPEGVYRSFGDQVVVDQEATLRLLKSRASVGGARVQVASLERHFLPLVDEPHAAAFFYFCAPETVINIFTQVVGHVRTQPDVATVLREFVTDVHDRHKITTLNDYLEFRHALARTEERLMHLCQAEEMTSALLHTLSRPAFIGTMVRMMLDRRVAVFATHTTRPDRLLTLPMSGMAALSRAADPARNRLRAQLYEVYFKLANDLRFKRLGYLVAPFSTSTTLQLPTFANYDNYQTLYFSLSRVLDALDADDEMLEDIVAAGEDEETTTRREYERIDRQRRSGELELRTLRNSLEREIETLHNGRTLWFELAMLQTDPAGYARNVQNELITLYNTLVSGRRIVTGEVREVRDTDTSSTAPLTLDPRAQYQADQAMINAPPRPDAIDAEADLRNASDRLEEFIYLIDSVQAAADAGEPIALLLRATEPAPVARPAATGANRLDLLDTLLGPRPTPAAQPPPKRVETGAEPLRTRLLAIARRGREGDTAARNEADEANDEAIQDAIAERRRAPARRRVGLTTVVAELNDDAEQPHATHKRASIIGLQKAAELAADASQVTARQMSFAASFGTPAELLEFLESARTFLGRLLGNKDDEEEEQTDEKKPPRKLRLLSNTGVVIGTMLKRITADVVTARLEQRRRAVDDLHRQRRAIIGVEVQANVVQMLLSQAVATNDTSQRITVGRRPLSTFELRVSVYLLDIDLARMQARARADYLLALQPPREFRKPFGKFMTTVQVPALYVSLLLPAAIERATLMTQLVFESGDAPQQAVPFSAKNGPYAVAQRSDAHQSLRIDELVRRYVLTGEVPLEANNRVYTPYHEQAAKIGRLAGTKTSGANLMLGAPSEQHVALNEGAHRQHASGTDVTLSALMVQLMHVYGSLRHVATLKEIYDMSRTKSHVEMTEHIATIPEARERMWLYLQMFFRSRPWALTHMRPIDMRLMALVMLGYDVSARTDNEPASMRADDSDDEDTPVMTPSYVHQRTNAAKRVLADAYYRTLIARLYGRDITPEERRDARDRGMTSPVVAYAVVVDGDSVTTEERIVERGSVHRTREYQRGLLHDEQSHVRAYERRLRDGKLRQREMDTIVTDRRILALPTLFEQSESLIVGDALKTANATLMALLAPKRRQQAQLIDQPWLLVPRIVMVRTLMALAQQPTVIDTFEKIVVTLDDSAHLLADDTNDDASELFAEQSEELKRTDEPASEPVEAASPTTSSSTSSNIIAKPPAVQRNPVTAAGSFDEWRASVQDALAKLMHLEFTALYGVFKPPRGTPLLAYEIDALAMGGITSSLEFYRRLAPALVLARFIVEDGIDTTNSDRLPSIDFANLEAVFGSDEVHAARRTLSAEQFELAKLLAHAELRRRMVWRPNAEGSAISGNHSVAESYATNVDESFTVDVFRALGEAYSGNKKRSAKTVLNDYRALRANSTLGTINWRMQRVVQLQLETNKPVRFDAVERFVPLYDAIQLLFVAGFSIDGNSVIESDQLHPLMPILGAPLTRRMVLLFRTAPFPERSLTSCRVSLVGVYASTYVLGSSAEAMRAAAARMKVHECAVLHDFAYSSPAAPPSSDGAKPKKVVRPSGNDYTVVNRVRIDTPEEGVADAGVELTRVLGESYDRTQLVRADRFRQLLPLIGMPVVPLNNQ